MSLLDYRHLTQNLPFPFQNKNQGGEEIDDNDEEEGKDEEPVGVEEEEPLRVGDVWRSVPVKGS